MILSLKDFERKTKSHTQNAEEIIAETVVISPVMPAAKEAEKTEDEAQQKKMPVEDILAETVILKPGEKSKNGTKK